MWLSGSIDLHPGIPHDPAPLRSFRFELRVEFIRRGTDRPETECLEPLLDVPHRDGLGDLPIELLDNGWWRCGRSHYANPESVVVALHARFGQRRNVGQERRAFTIRHRERAQSAVLDVRRYQV